ncbi:hypothetical protein [Pontibacter flavimaris]|uniref:Uncharacterized protein n=1 Tax=Pontibacter flavimaris TaxID=1797110 RepID=A0A1Q5PCK1_9BACT|nr:hypothetical protein [Pontibacter flavimaris]OKL39968.1 hypothetical protein A3841_16530 [Pontibacter flavimaris]
MKYTVLWIDDEYQKQDDVISDAEFSDIRLVPFTTHEEGMHELERNLAKYDGVILDAKVLKNVGDDVPGLGGLRASILRLEQLSTKKRIPYFIFTGQADYMESSVFEDGFGKYYVKARDNEKLFTDIKAAADKLEDTQIKHRYQSAFDVCTEAYIGQSALEPLLAILRSFSNPEAEIDDELYFNQLRIILEKMFRCAHRFGLSHAKCIDEHGQVILAASSLFMSGLEVKYLGIKAARPHFPKLIASHVRIILEITNAASHSETQEADSSKTNLSEYRNTVNTPYLLYSLAFKLLDILIWFKYYVDQNNDYETNKALWVSAIPEEVTMNENTGSEGVIINKNIKGFAFFSPNDNSGNAFVPPALVNKFSLAEGTRVLAITRVAEKGLQVETITILN